MNFFKSQFDRIQQQLQGLTASQKMLTASLVAIMVITLTYWARYAGEPEMEPVLNQSFSEADISQITTRLSAKGVHYRVSGDKVMVAADRKMEVLADLGYSHLLPRNTATGFEEMIKQMSPWDPASKTAMFVNQAKQVTLADVIRNFPHVDNAMVLIDQTAERQIGGNIDPSATVNITMRDQEKPNKQLINAAADVIAGAVAQLPRDRIKVVVDGVSYPVTDSRTNALGGSADIVELRQMHERRYADKIAEQLGFIKGVMVSVNVDLNVETKSQVQRTIDIKNTLQKEIETTNHTEETNSTSPMGGDPGSVSNVGVSVVGSGGGGTSATVEDNKVKLMVEPSYTNLTISTPAGDAKVLSASVRVPRSYFVSIIKSANPNAKDPDEAALRPLIDDQLPRIRNDVKKCTGLKADDDISVDTYYDVMPLFATAPASTSSPASVPLMVSSHVKEIAVGVLAVISMSMVMMMVRKSAPVVVSTVIPRHEEPTQLGTVEDVAGEVGEGNAMLDGMELDEDAVKTQQMLDQVSTMVKESPDSAANLVKRWLNRT